MTWKIDPLHIATQGLLSKDTLTIASQGFLVKVEVEEKPGPVPPKLIGSGDFIFFPTGSYQKEDKHKEITVTVIIKGRKYVKKAYTNNLKIQARDIKVDIIESEKPQIKVKILTD